MPKIEWLQLISFIIITNFSPGPNVIPAMSMGIMYGFKKAFPFCAGVFFGYIFLMFVGAFIANALLAAFPAFETILRIASALYITWLAYQTFKRSFALEMQNQPPQGFWQGFMLQAVNVKGMLFGLTVFSTFLFPLAGFPLFQVLAIFGLACSALAATVTYALFGASIHRYLKNPKIRRIISIALALLLFLTALRVVGFFDWIDAVWIKNS